MLTLPCCNTILLVAERKTGCAVRIGRPGRGEWIYYVCTMMQSLGDNGRIHFFDVEVEAQGPDLARGRQPRVNRQCNVT